jgi:TusA-related sulfurtransferase
MRFNDEMDLRGVPCPTNAARACLKLATMDSGQLLRVILDNGAPVENLPSAIEEDGHSIEDKMKFDEGSTSFIIRVF